jgi:hypothetical protein
MAFNYNGNTFVSFANYADVTVRDQRFFEANEGFTELQVIDLLTQSSLRILNKIRSSDWWRDYNFKRNSSLNNDVRQVPVVNPNNIDGREQEFKDLNIYHCLYEYLLPRVADFGNATSAEMEKIKFYKEAFEDLYKEIIEAGDWYDYNGDNTIAVSEKQPVRINLVRVR